MLNKLKKIAAVITAVTAIGCVGNVIITPNQMSGINMTACGYYYGNYEYAIFEDGTRCAIIKYSGTEEIVVIPPVINGMKVVQIENKAFYENKTVKKVVLPDTVNMLFDRAFYGCENLETINTPDSLKSIGTSCFENCSKLKSFNFNKVEKIGWYVLKNCKSIEEIYVPGTIKSVPVAAFDGCSNLKTLTFAEGVKEIGIHAAFNTPSLEKITIPESVTTINNYAIGYSNLNGMIMLTVDNLKEYNFVQGSAAEKYGIDNGIIEVFEGELSTENKLPINPVIPEIIMNKGDIDLSGSVDSSDASAVLAEYSAVQTGKKETFTAAQKIAADVNSDGTVDSSDASEILRYYSEASTGKTPAWSFVEKLPSKREYSVNF